MNKKSIIAMVSTALLVTEVGKAQNSSSRKFRSINTKNIVKSIQSQAYPLKTIEPPKSFEDLKPLKK